MSVLCVFVSPACVPGSILDDKEVDDPGGEVQSDLRFAVDDGDAVPVAVAGSGHTTAEQQERGPGHAHRVAYAQGQAWFSLLTD